MDMGSCNLKILINLGWMSPVLVAKAGLLGVLLLLVSEPSLRQAVAQRASLSARRPLFISMYEPGLRAYHWTEAGRPAQLLGMCPCFDSDGSDGAIPCTWNHRLFFDEYFKHINAHPKYAWREGSRSPGETSITFQEVLQAR
jgi:hypothetical protein